MRKRDKMSRRKKRKRISLLGLGVSAAVLMMISKAFIMQPEINRNNDKIEKLQSAIEYEKVRAEEVENLQDKVNTDEYIEKVAREQLGLVKENEKIFIDIASQ